MSPDGRDVSAGVPFENDTEKRALLLRWAPVPVAGHISTPWPVQRGCRAKRFGPCSRHSSERDSSARSKRLPASAIGLPTRAVAFGLPRARPLCVSRHWRARGTAARITRDGSRDERRRRYRPRGRSRTGARHHLRQYRAWDGARRRARGRRRRDFRSHRQALRALRLRDLAARESDVVLSDTNRQKVAVRQRRAGGGWRQAWWEPAWYRVPHSGAWRSLVSALVWGTRGPEFKSRRPDRRNAPVRGRFLA